MTRPDFSDPNQWEIVPNVPVLDEHVITDRGRTVRVDRARLQRIAANTNRRYAETGDPIALIVGHTEDGPGAEERPVVGYAKDLRVAPWKGDKSCLLADLYYRRDKAHVAADFPRRSVELWLAKDEIDPIALLGGTTPERDLGVVLKYARGGDPEPVYHRTFPEPDMSRVQTTPPARVRYEADPGRDAAPAAKSEAEADADGKEAEKFKALLLKVLPDVLRELGFDDEPMAGDDPMGGADGYAGADPLGPPADHDSREMHEGPPVRFADYSAPSGANCFVPGDRERTQMSRQTTPPAKPAAPTPDPEVLRLSRQVESLAQRNAELDADRTLASLKADGYEFGPEAEEAGERDLLVKLARTSPEAFAAHVDRIRKRYSRRAVLPPTDPDYLRYSRQTDPQAAGTPAENEVIAYARAMQRRGEHVTYDQAKEAVAARAAGATRTK